MRWACASRRAWHRGRPQVVGVLPALRAPQTAVMDAIEQNKNTVTEFIDALFTKGDLGAIDGYLTEEFVNHDPPIGVTADREGMRAAGAMFRAAFPDPIRRTRTALTGTITRRPGPTAELVRVRSRRPF